MLGRVEKQIGFSDIWLEGRIPENSYWSILRKWAENYLNDDMFQPLFSYYGKKSVPPVYTFLATLIQFNKGYSDREMEEASRFDDRIKYAITAPRDFEGIDAVTLHDHRKRFFLSGISQKIFESCLEEAREKGLFDSENLNMIDSFMVWGASAKQGTYEMIFKGIQNVLVFTRFYEMEEEVRALLKGTDYKLKKKKPEIDWSSKKEKGELIDRLVKDAIAIISYLEKKEIKEDLKRACELLKRVALQDVKKNESGNYEIYKGTAKDRIISTNDTEIRHGHKTTSKQQDGYKAEIITGGEKGEFVLGIEVDGANTKDGKYMEELINKADEIKEVKKIYGDCAYCDFDVIEKYEDEKNIDFVVKIPPASNKKGFYTKEDFNINLETGEVMCPAWNSANFDCSKLEEKKPVTAKFSAVECDKCKLKDKCTNSKTGRSISIHVHEHRLQEGRKEQKTENFKKDYAKRSNVERRVQQLVVHGGRKGKYIGKVKTKWQLLMVSLNNNIKQLMNYIILGKYKDIGEVYLKAA